MMTSSVRLVDAGGIFQDVSTNHLVPTTCRLTRGPRLEITCFHPPNFNRHKLRSVLGLVHSPQFDLLLCSYLQEDVVQSSEDILEQRYFRSSSTRTRSVFALESCGEGSHELWDRSNVIQIFQRLDRSSRESSLVIEKRPARVLFHRQPAMLSIHHDEWCELSSLCLLKSLHPHVHTLPTHHHLEQPQPAPRSPLLRIISRNVHCSWYRLEVKVR